MNYLFHSIQSKKLKVAANNSLQPTPRAARFVNEVSSMRILVSQRRHERGG